MSAQPTLRIVPAETTDTTAPRWKVRAEREADRRHTVLVTLEQLYRETPWYCLRSRYALAKAIHAHMPTLWRP